MSRAPCSNGLPWEVIDILARCRGFEPQLDMEIRAIIDREACECGAPCGDDNCPGWVAKYSPFSFANPSGSHVAQLTPTPTPHHTPDSVERDAFIGVTASLAAAVSLLEGGGKKAAPSDKMFEMMLSDYRKALAAAREILNASRTEMGGMG